MADSDSLFDDDDFAESFAGEPSEELLRESDGSFADFGGLESDGSSADLGGLESDGSFADLGGLDSEGSFADLGGLDSDTPDAGIPQEELIAKAQAETALKDNNESVVESKVESEADGAVVAAKPAKKKGRFGSFDTSQFTIFDLALLISLFFISLATLMMFFELRTFGNFPFDGFPWRTDKF